MYKKPVSIYSSVKFALVVLILVPFYFLYADSESSSGGCGSPSDRDCDGVLSADAVARIYSDCRNCPAALSRTDADDNDARVGNIRSYLNN